jgi:hypothetical protein
VSPPRSKSGSHPTMGSASTHAPTFATLTCLLRSTSRARADCRRTFRKPLPATSEQDPSNAAATDDWTRTKRSRDRVIATLRAAPRNLRCTRGRRASASLERTTPRLRRQTTALPGMRRASATAVAEE